MNRFAQAIASTFELLSRFVVPLYFDDRRGRPQLVGSAFFVRRGSATLLVSAAHVLEEGRSRQLYYYAAAKTKRWVSGKFTCNAWTGPRENDLLDLAAVRLEGPALPPYQDLNKWPLDVTTITYASAPVPTARYGLIGFPASRSRIRVHPAEVRVEPYGHLAQPAPLREYAARGLRAESHLYLVFNRKKSIGLQGQGVSFPKPHGLSGSPVFEIYDEAKSHQGEAFPLAGVVTTWRPQEHRLLCAASAALRELIEVAA